LGKHTLGSLGRDLSYSDLLKVGNDIYKSGKIEPEHFATASRGILNTDRLISYGIKIGASTVASIINNGVNSVANNKKHKNILLAHDYSTNLGENDAKYITTKIHIGYPTTERLKRMKNNPSVQLDEKLFGSSDKDYQEHEKRKNLFLQTGFNQKGFAFLMEDTFLTVKDYLNFYDRRQTIENTLIKAKKNKLIQYYACDYKTHNKFKFRNTMDFYNLALRIHLVKITDIDEDVRKLIGDITNNRLAYCQCKL